MTAQAWKRATKDARDLKEYADFIVDDLKARHIRAAVRWTDDALVSATKIRKFLRRLPGTRDLGQAPEIPTASMVFLAALGGLALYAIID